MPAAAPPPWPFLTDPICSWCGQPRELEILEVWSPREFQLATCCETLHEEVAETLTADPRAAAALLRHLGLEALTGQKLRRVVDVDGQLVLDWTLQVRASVSWATVRDFIARHHRHCPPPAGWKFGAGVFNGAELVGVISVGRPVARMFDPGHVLEVNRVCVRGDLPSRDLVWNACSQLYGWAARETVRRGFAKVITYTREDEAGTSLHAAGWVVEHQTRGRSWDAPSRSRTSTAQRVDKLRWTPKAMLGEPLRPNRMRQKKESPRHLVGG